jgi:hypothetical protein
MAIATIPIAAVLALSDSFGNRVDLLVGPAVAVCRPSPRPLQPQPAKHISMTWMQRLKRVFAIDIETCQRCGGPLKVIA